MAQRRPGGDARPSDEYIVSNNPDISASAASARTLICRSGCPSGTTMLGEISATIEPCFSSEPRMSEPSVVDERVDPRRLLFGAPPLTFFSTLLKRWAADAYAFFGPRQVDAIDAAKAKQLIADLERLTPGIAPASAP